MKNNTFLKSLLQKVSILVIALCIPLTMFACTGSAPTEPPAWATTYTLPSNESVNERLLEIYGSQDKMYLLDNTIQRMPCPQDGAVMSFNMTYSVDSYVKIVMEDAIEEINQVFSVINPNYKFKINYNPSQEDLSSKYSIRMTLTDNFSSPTVMGTAQITPGSYLSNFGITLKDTAIDDLRYLMLTFRHEFMHLLGAGDAYKNPQAEKTTVMQNYNNTSYRHFSSTDVSFIDAYYRNPNNANTDAYIKNYIANYENNNTHTQSILLSKVMHLAINQLNLLNFGNELQAKNYKNAQNLVHLIQNGLTLNTNFGSQQISFTELEYVEEYKPEETYYGSFNPTKGQYTHGKNKNGLGSAQIISYKNLGSGILLAMPGGTNNMTLFVQTANYVLTLHAGGLILSTDSTYAVRFSEINLSLLSACTIN